MRKKLLFAISCTMLTCALYAQVYKWTDSHGVVHFSDSPHAGSEQLKIPDAQTFSPPVSNTPESISNPGNTSVTENSTQYSKIEIMQPINQATIRNNQGYVVVSVVLVPSLVQGDTLQMIFDGAPLGDPQPNLIFELSGIYRGSHTLAVSVLNEKGEVLKTSEPITIFMQRPRGAKVKEKDGNQAVKN